MLYLGVKFTSLKNHFSNSFEICCVQRQTETDLDNLAEHTVNDYWNINGAASLSDEWVG